MKLTSLLFASLALASSASAQYFSEGWKPGQPVSKSAPTATSAGFTPGAAAATETAAVKRSLFDLSTYLESGPLKKLFDRSGVNITERLAAAREQAKIWDDRIPLITDDNYEDIIVNETLTFEEERDRVWFLVMCVL